MTNALRIDPLHPQTVFSSSALLSSLLMIPDPFNDQQSDYLLLTDNPPPFF